MVDAREFLKCVAGHLVANGGRVGSHEIHFEYLEKWLKEMEAEQTMKEIVKKINELCKEYLGFVESAGNECAYTDRVVEEIISKANELKTKYDEEV